MTGVDPGMNIWFGSSKIKLSIKCGNIMSLSLMIIIGLIRFCNHTSGVIMLDSPFESHSPALYCFNRRLTSAVTIRVLLSLPTFGKIVYFEFAAS